MTSAKCNEDKCETGDLWVVLHILTCESLIQHMELGVVVFLYIKKV